MSIEDELLELEHRFWRALQANDGAAALSLTDDPCIVAGASGVGSIDHAMFADMMAGATYTLTEYEITAPEARMVSADVATIAYNVREELIVDGEPLTLNAADTSVWVRREGGWVCAMHTESVLGDSYGRDRVPTA
jgi:hypothetical protein